MVLDVIEPWFVFGSDVIEPMIVGSDVIEPMIILLTEEEDHLYNALRRCKYPLWA